MGGLLSKDIDTSKDIYLCIKPEYYVIKKDDITKYKITKKDKITDSNYTSFFKKFLNKNKEYIFDEKKVKIKKVEKKNNKILYTLKYNTENLSLDKEESLLADGLKKITYAGDPILFKKKIYFYLHLDDTKLYQ